MTIYGYEYHHIRSGPEAPPTLLGLSGDSFFRGRERLLRASAHALSCIKKASGGRSKDVQRKSDEKILFWKDDLVNPSEQMERVECQERTIHSQEEKIQKQTKTIEDQKKKSLMI